MKKILLIGKNGQLAHELLNDASSFGFEIIAFNKEELDVTQPLQIEEKIKQINPAILINTSAYHVVPLCEKNPLPALEVNFIAVQNLARICKKIGIPFVTYSTDYVFDGKKSAPYLEADLPHPLQVYGLSKLAGEYAALSSYPEGTFMIRTCGLYGGKTGSPEKGGNFVLNLLKDTKNQNAMEVSSEQRVSPTYAGDLSKATLKLLSREVPSGIYHLVNRGDCSWYEFAKEIFKLSNIKIALKPVDRGGLDKDMKRPLFSALENTKAKALGVELPSWQEGLKSYLDFLNSMQK
ncbi:MAG: dTDP-4-dehydrorhamnose reductase [Candidatus Gracilibacteria bacterium]|jgi:dTDP-4-dehydrorhamnose reductase